VNQSAHHALVNAGERDIACKKEGEKKGSVRGNVQGRCDYTTALDMRLIPDADAFADTRQTLLFRPM